ncbi:hypothetical protein ONE63_005518 [Megalurothrips usitatus]|uniref:Uncharacterized protein n=1 Tax=Megalurothrips usitatus TaxID=439358 RepID=A0AAV7Y0M6_9NEOP|nr:hypothetical protein ONE63_005518 [Megalurothrips usitatus]
MARHLSILLALAVAVAVAHAATIGEQYDACLWGGFEVKPDESVISANALGMCKRCRCEAAEMVCEEEQLPCDPYTVGAAAAAPAEPKTRTARASSAKPVQCGDKLCVTACIKENGKHKCA